MLNDYCEAAGAIVALQRKVSKALKEAAALKTTNEIAGNALNVSAHIFDVLSDIDAKFAKIADRECGTISSEVTKWFGKLADEEKAHDERMNDSNARIKQAGQAYEKKAKKSARDVGEEHARYVNLLSMLGPEMSQEKYNHALLVTQQHTSITYSVAACVSRVADAEWMRTCESIRRFSPSIGPLGEWRALCEGAWTGHLPDDLLDISPAPTQAALPTRGVTEWGQNIPPGKHEYQTSLAFLSQTNLADLEPPHPPFSSNEQNQNQGSINSITTLSAFPFPPTHFPIPLAANEAELQRQRTQMQSLQVPQPAQQHTLLSESPQPIESMLSDTHTLVDFKLHSASQQTIPSSSQYMYSDNPFEERIAQEIAGPGISASSSEKEVLEQSQSQSCEEAKFRRSSLIAGATSSEKILSSKQTEHTSSEREFSASVESCNAFKSRSIDVAKKTLERSDSSVSNGNIVAAMRDRYSRTIEPLSAAPKDVPRLPMSVSDLAFRYQPMDEPMTPRRSPTVDRQAVNQGPSASKATRDSPIDEEDIRRRRQNIEQLAGLELKEKEYHLRQHERELDQKTCDFGHDRMHFLDAQGDLISTSDTPKSPRATLFQHRRGSQSTSHLVPLLNSTSPQQRESQSPSRSQPSSPLPAKGHAPFCGCDTCSVAKYIAKYKMPEVSPSPYDLRPPEPPILPRSEQPRSWIRRLSMPAVGAAFSLDAKKNMSATSLKSGLSFVDNGKRGKRSFDQGISNRSVGVVRR